MNRDPASTRPRKWTSDLLAKWVLLPVVALVLIIGGIILLVPAIAASKGHGIHGFWSAETYICTRPNECYWQGTFKASHGNLIVHYVDYYGMTQPENPGSGIQALYPGGGYVFPPNGLPSAWHEPALFVSIGVILLAWWIGAYPVRFSRRN
jgi:hypothetical protein